MYFGDNQHLLHKTISGIVRNIQNQAGLSSRTKIRLSHFSSGIVKNVTDGAGKNALDLQPGYWGSSFGSAAS